MAQKLNNNRVDRGKNKKAGNDAPESPAARKQRLAKQYGIKPKTKAFVDLLNDDIGITQVEAYRRLHPIASYNTAASASTNLLKKTSVIGYKDAAVKKAKRRIIELVDSGNESVALKASESIIDRNEGKAVQKSESTQQVVTVKLDLSGARLGAHYIRPEQLPAIE